MFNYQRQCSISSNHVSIHCQHFMFAHLPSSCIVLSELNVVPCGHPRDNSLTRDQDVFQTIRSTRIDNIEPFHGCMLYEGYPMIYKDMKVYELGKYARHENRCYGTLPYDNSREWDEHVCVLIGKGMPLFNSVIKIEDVRDIDIFEGLAIKLLGMCGLDWDRLHGCSLPSHVVATIKVNC